MLLSVRAHDADMCFTAQAVVHAFLENLPASPPVNPPVNLCQPTHWHSHPPTFPPQSRQALTDAVVGVLISAPARLPTTRLCTHRSASLAQPQELLIKSGKQGTATQIEELLTEHDIIFSNKETKMTLINIRLHLRVLRRLSMAVVDQRKPSYEQSALYFFDRSEEVFGRRAPEVALQESTKAMDAFQAGIPDLDDLRVASETFHIMLLRGYNIRPAARQTSEVARSLVHYTKIPAALAPRFPKFAAHLVDFVSLRTFHLKYPHGKDLEGNDLPEQKPEYPIHASECLDKLVQEIFIPLMTFKKHQSLLASSSPLALPWVRDLLPVIEQMYIAELKPDIKLSVASSDQDMPDIEIEPVTEEEADALRKKFNADKDRLMDTMASEHLARFVVFLEWGAENLVEKVNQQPMMRDGAARLFMFNAGTDCTKDPPMHVSPWRMKGMADEEHLSTCIEVATKLLTDADTIMLISGRNSLIYKDMRKKILDLKPKLSSKELVMEPDEAQFMQHIRIDANAFGSIDLKDPYIQVVKTSKVWKTRKSMPRRFVPGNTAFKKMSSLPMLSKESLTSISFAEREQVFRGVTPTDKWSHAARAANKQQPDSSGSEDEETPADQSQAVAADASAKTVFFWMELHPKVCAQLLWETNARVLVDFTPGPGSLITAALAMQIKTVAIVHNLAHKKALMTICCNFIRAQIAANNMAFTPQDKNERMEALKPARLRAYEGGKKRGNEDSSSTSPAAKRAALADNVEAMLGGTALHAKPKPQPPKPMPKAASKGTAEESKGTAEEQGGAPSSAANTGAQGGTEVGGPSENLQDLLRQWAV